MESFQDLNLSKQLRNALDDLKFSKPTPIQEKAFAPIMSGKDLLGIAQTGTGKTLAYMLPILQDFKFSKQVNPRVLVMVPTRELVIQVVDNIEKLAEYISLRVLGVYGGTNINTQAQFVAQGCDVLVATPGRLYDLTLNRALQLKAIKKLVIDEVVVMLDLGFRFLLNNIFELLPERRQNMMFSATMTDEVELLIDSFFNDPIKISIAVSGTPLENIEQSKIKVQNFYTKINLLAHLIDTRSDFEKVLVFVAKKKNADILFDQLQEKKIANIGIIHSNKSQNYRIRMVEEFDEGKIKIMISTDVMARGLDLNEISHVINMDTPEFPENYMHRIGRTGRAEKKGQSLLFYSEREGALKDEIEKLMHFEIPKLDFPDEVETNQQKLDEERDRQVDKYSRNSVKEPMNKGFHEKSEKNSKVNLGGSYKREIEKKYKKPKTRGDKKANNRKNKK
jgi:ATP-dependent RNA helicase RhlE